MVELTRDSMQYGVCLERTEGDSILFLTDEGDTVWLVLSERLQVAGKIEAGEQLAIMTAGGSRQNSVIRAINTSMLAGEWVESDPIAEGNVKGYQIADGGAVEGINLPDVNLEGWALYNGRLLISGSYGVEQFTDTFEVRVLTADSLWLIARTETHFLHRMQPGEANYENATYDFDADPTVGLDFNPESKDVEVSPEILGDGPVY